MKIDKTRGLTIAAALFGLWLLASCASMGNPDGGPYDETPPVFLSSTPRMGSLNSRQSKVTLNFDEFIKLQSAADKVVISPPQIESPEVKASGRKVIVDLQDTLKANTTYTIDFGDAIVDNNEGNPLGNFAFVFSTGDRIDSMQVAGTVLDASNLEPIKGMLVGLHSNLNDSAFTKLPFERVSRTNASGRFSIKGVAPGSYRIFALNDANQNYRFDQRSEMIAFADSLVIPTCRPDVRQDTTWVDSLTYDTIKTVDYTHYYPDNLVLRAFTEPNTFHYLSKYERNEHPKFTLTFSSPSDSLPLLRGLNFDEKNAFVIEKNAGNDSITYWIRDSLLYNRDTLEVELTYMASVDTLDYLVSRTDTLSLVPKKSYDKLQEEKLKAYNEAVKKFQKANRKKQADGTGNEAVYVPPVEFLKVSPRVSGTMNINDNIYFSFAEPLAGYDSTALHLYHMKDSVWEEAPFVFEQVEGKMRDYVLRGEWREKEEFKFVFDSLAFKGIYGLYTDKMEQQFKFRSLNEYGTLFITVPEAGDSSIVELLDAQGNAKRRELTEKGTANFYFVNPGKYYLRLIIDRNRNGKWDTGDYATLTQPEEVYYYPRPLDVRALWDYDQNDWNIHSPLPTQKPLEITKQKPEQKKEKQSKNEKRLQQKGR